MKKEFDVIDDKGEIYNIKNVETHLEAAIEYAKQAQEDNSSIADQSQKVVVSNLDSSYEITVTTSNSRTITATKEQGKM